MLAIGLGLIFLIFSYFGSVSAIITLVVFIVMCFVLVNQGFTKHKIPVGATPGLANEDTEQADRKCLRFKKTFFGGENSFMNNILGSNGSYGKFLNKLKNLSKEFG